MRSRYYYGGIVLMKAEGYASISSSHNQSEWLKVGQSFEHNLIKEIQADRIIIVTPNDDERLISLAVTKRGASISTGGLISIEQLNGHELILRQIRCAMRRLICPI